MKASEAVKSRTWGAGFRALSWVLLLAFTLQSFITQTHLHGAIAHHESSATAASAVAHKNAPAENSAADCPFCQAIIHAGAFYAPSTQALVVPLSWSATAVRFFIGKSVAGFPPHRWYSRAPPRH